MIINVANVVERTVELKPSFHLYPFDPLNWGNACEWSNLLSVDRVDRVGDKAVGGIGELGGGVGAVGVNGVRGMMFLVVSLLYGKH